MIVLTDATDDERLAVLAVQILDVQDLDGLVWIFDLRRQRFRTVEPSEALRLCLDGRATLSEPRTTAVAQGIAD